MNKNHNSTGSIQKIEDDTNRFFQGASFGGIHFDGAGQSTAFKAALGILDEAQGRCMDYYMQTSEVRDACDYLSRNDKVRPLAKRFWESLVIEDQTARFEASAQALRVIRQQFGV